MESAPASSRSLMGAEGGKVGPPRSSSRWPPPGRTGMGDETGRLPGVPSLHGCPQAFAGNGHPQALPPKPVSVLASAAERQRRMRPTTDVAGRAALARTTTIARAVIPTTTRCPQACVMESLASLQVRRCHWSHITSCRQEICIMTLDMRMRAPSRVCHAEHPHKSTGTDRCEGGTDGLQCLA